MSREEQDTVAIPAEQWVPMAWLDLGEYTPPSGRRFRVRAPVIFSIQLEDVEDPSRPDVAVPGEARGWVLETMMPQVAERLKAAVGGLAEHFQVVWPAEGTSVGAALGDPPAPP
jgi:hypothetical protein